jgi:hypothetical protein
MEKTRNAPADDWRPEEPPSEEGEITHPMRIICSRKGAPTASRIYWLKKKAESAPRTPDWTEIGDPAA